MSHFENTRYYLDCFDKSCQAREDIDIVYNSGRDNIVCIILSAIDNVIKDIDEFYSYKSQPKIEIFIYPDISLMSKAFGREIKSDDWCFVPIIGANSLITFSANINTQSIPQILMHEFSHIYFSSITGNRDIGNYRQSIPMWLNEGIALCLDSKYRNNFEQTVDNRMKILMSKDCDYFPELMDLNVYFNRLDEDEFGIKSQKAYSYSYFCVKDMIDNFGEKHIREFLNIPDLAIDFDRLFEVHFECSLDKYNIKMSKKFGV